MVIAFAGVAATSRKTDAECTMAKSQTFLAAAPRPAQNWVVQYGRVLPCSNLRVLKRQEGVLDIYLLSLHTIVLGDRGCYIVQLLLCLF